MSRPNSDRTQRPAGEKFGSVFAWFGAVRRKAVKAYFASLLAVALATFLRILMNPALDDHHPFTLYFAAVVFASWYGGFGPGILTIVLSYFAADWFFIKPRYEINWPRENLDEFLALMAFLFSGLAIAISTSLMRRALRTSQRKQKELEHEVAVRQKAEKSLHEAQVQLRQHAALLEERVTERTRYLRETILSLEGVCYHLAHDLRAPLRAMDGFTSLLLNECSSGLDETGRGHAEKIVQAAERMDLLIDGLMEYGRLGHEYYPIEPIQAKITLKRALSQLNQDSQDSLVTLGTSWPEVLGNVALLELVFFHLLNNALKFIRPRVVPRIRVWIEDRSPCARVWVEDNGIGLPMDYADKAFGIFQRLHPTEQYPGTGMGLAIVAKAVSRMKGRVGVESNLHDGSRFWFELPLAPNNISMPASMEPQLENKRLVPA